MLSDLWNVQFLCGAFTPRTRLLLSFPIFPRNKAQIYKVKIQFSLMWTHFYCAPSCGVAWKRFCLSFHRYIKAPLWCFMLCNIFFFTDLVVEFNSELSEDRIFKNFERCNFYAHLAFCKKFLHSHNASYTMRIDCVPYSGVASVAYPST